MAACAAKVMLINSLVIMCLQRCLDYICRKEADGNRADGITTLIDDLRRVVEISMAATVRLFVTS